MSRLLLPFAGLLLLLALLPSLRPIEFPKAANASSSIAQSREIESLKARLEALHDRVSLLNQEIEDSLAALEP